MEKRKWIIKTLDIENAMYKYGNNIWKGGKREMHEADLKKKRKEGEHRKSEGKIEN